MGHLERMLDDDRFQFTRYLFLSQLMLMLGNNAYFQGTTKEKTERMENFIVGEILRGKVTRNKVFRLGEKIIKAKECVRFSMSRGHIIKLLSRLYLDFLLNYMEQKHLDSEIKEICYRKKWMLFSPLKLESKFDMLDVLTHL